MIKLKTEIDYPDVANAVEQANEQRLSAMRKGDAAALKELLADDLVYVFSTGIVENKAGHLKAIEQGTVKYEDDLHIRDLEIRAFSENAVVNGVLESHILLNGVREHLVNRFTMFWVKHENRWQMSMWQSTAIPTRQTSETLSDDAAGEVAVRALYQQLMDAWNKGSGDAFAAPFAEDGDLVGFDGTHFRGRPEIASFHQPLFDKWMKGTRLVGEVKHLRFLTSDVAVIHAIGGTIMRGKSKPDRVRDSIQTLVAVRTDGELKLAAFQNTRLRSMSSNFASVLLWNFTDWLWKFLLRKSLLRKS